MTLLQEQRIELRELIEQPNSDNPTGEMKIIDANGDMTVTWDARQEVEVERAKKVWNNLVKGAKYAAFRMDSSGHAGEKVREFDPSVERLLMRPQTQGG